MKIAREWKDYTIIATSDGMKLEDWNGVILLRPDPQVIWQGRDLYSYDNITAVKRAAAFGKSAKISPRNGRCLIAT